MGRACLRSHLTPSTKLRAISRKASRGELSNSVPLACGSDYPCTSRLPPSNLSDANHLLQTDRSPIRWKTTLFPSANAQSGLVEPRMSSLADGNPPSCAKRICMHTVQDRAVPIRKFPARERPRRSSVSIEWSLVATLDAGIEVIHE